MKPSLRENKLTVRLNDQVFRLDIPMNDLLLVDVLETSDEACYKETYTTKSQVSTQTVI